LAWQSHKGVIYLVDDDAELLATLQETLEGHGYFVLPARDGVEALARMQGGYGKSLAIVDLKMPRMDGFELISRMRASEKLAGIPIVAMSSMFGSCPGHSVEGADRLMPKPCEVPKLLRTIDELMHWRRAACLLD
jgi:CheY-like chemotaxis protein